MNKGFVLHVQGCGCLVQQDNRRIFEECPGNGNALALTAGQLTTVFPNVRVPLVRQLFGKFIYICKPGRRQYVSSEDIPRVLSGLGIAIVSTSRGVMTGAQARKQSIGGELLALVW